MSKIAEQIESVCEQICKFYCKKPQEVNERWLRGELKDVDKDCLDDYLHECICAYCPLTRL